MHHWATQMPAMDVAALAKVVADKVGRGIILSSIHTAEVRRVLADAPDGDFMVEISHMEGPVMCAQDLVRDMGADRVLLGTQMPFMNPAGAMLAMGEPGFNEGDRDKVMGGNAARVLGL